MSDESFSADEIRSFLEAVDRHLRTTTEVTIIGGGAAALSYQISSSTDDLDTYTALGDELREAIALATAETGLAIPMQKSGVAEAPYDFEDRLERPLPQLEKLRVRTLEKHDLVLSKSLRCDEHDLQQIVELHQSSELDFDVLVNRYLTEMDHLVGDANRRRSLFLVMIHRVFGELKHVAAERLIPRKP